LPSSQRVASSLWILCEGCVHAFGVCGGRPTFEYTRIEVEGTLGRLAAGETIASIIAGYDGRITQEAIEIAMRHLIETLPQAIAA
jgi:uncharacterized protein (DUF433 family)